MYNSNGQFIAKSYATAIFEIAEERNCVEIVAQELDGLVDVITKNEQFMLFFQNPSIFYEQKQKIILNVFKDKLTPLMLDFAGVILKNGKITIIDDIKRCFDRLSDEKKGFRFLEIILAKEFDENNKKSLIEKLEKACNHKFKVEFIVNPEIIGGIIIRQKDMVIDNSIKTALDRAAGIIRNRI